MFYIRGEVAGRSLDFGKAFVERFHSIIFYHFNWEGPLSPQHVLNGIQLPFELLDRASSGCPGKKLLSNC